MKLSDDLINLLHEKAGEQYGPLWWEINRQFVTMAQDQGHAPVEFKALLSTLAYAACQLVSPAKPNYLTAIHWLRLNRDEANLCIKEGDSDGAGRFAALAVKNAKALGV